MSKMRVSCLLCFALLICSANGHSTNFMDTLSNNAVIKQLFENQDLLQKKVSQLESSEIAMKNSVRELKQDNLILKQENSDLKSEIQEISKILNDVKQLTDVAKDEHLTKEKTDAENNTLPIQMQSVVKLARGQRQIQGAVGFTAYLDHVVVSGVDQPVVFNQVLTNERQGYSSNTGIFRAPVSGLYLISWAVTARQLPGQNGYDVWAKLMVNGKFMLDAVAESFSDKFDSQGSSTAVLMLNLGDEVWVANTRASDIHGDPIERSTSFTGVLLFETEGHGSVIGK